jgi:hypothetical protein
VQRAAGVLCVPAGTEASPSAAPHRFSLIEGLMNG